MESRSRFAVHVAVVLAVFVTLLLLSDACSRSGNGRYVCISGRDTVRAAVSFDFSMYDSHRQGFPVGFEYDLLRRYALAQGCTADVSVNRRDSVDWWSALLDGTVDVIVVEHPDSVISLKKDSVLLSIPSGDYAWAVRGEDTELLGNINVWLGWYRQSDEYRSLRARFFRSYSLPDSIPVEHPGIGCISPYDDEIKKYSGVLGWDWRLLASLIYQESRFSMNIVSDRGATGLMQVRPATARTYGVSDIYDPEENIRAGVMHLKKLQRMFPYPEYDSVNVVKFTLASYNCGEGRIQDCIGFASDNGYDPHQWEQVAEAITLMKRPDGETDVSSLRLGKFSGGQTVLYVRDVLSRYEHYRGLVRPL